MKAAHLTLEHTLPCCGLALTMRSTPNEPDAHGGWVKTSTTVLHDWLGRRITHHRCELVSAENPYGIAPREKAGGK